MVKRQKEKLYQSSSEHKANAALRASGKPAAGGSAAASRRLLPFSHCALTLTAYTTPVCNAQGIVFENSAILPFVLQHGMDPCTGKPMTSRDLITLRMDQNDAGQWQCPILHKTFANHSKIVAILVDNNNDNNKSSGPNKRTANVYSFQAYQELNVKANHYEDFLTGQAFDKKKDVLILYDPNDDDLNQRRDINTFYHIQNARQLASKEQKKADSIQHGMTATRIMAQLAKNKKQQKQQQAVEDSKKRARSDQAKEGDADGNSNKRLKNRHGEILARDVTGVRYTTAGGAASFTSTGVEVRSDNTDRPATEEEILQAVLLLMRGKSPFISKTKLKNKKGLVKIVTNMGDIAVELHCDIAPRTCYNFLGLCREGTYNGSKFHRLIPQFMIQGGKAATSTSDKKNSSEQDDSYWGNRPFKDEFDDRLKHDGPGILSMANSGPNTNRRQFYFTFKACPHLDRKHSVFGHVIDGMKVLNEMEKVPTNTDAKKDHRPVHKIQIQSTIVLVDPAQEAQELEQARLDEIIRSRKRQAQKQTAGAATSKTARSIEKSDKDSSTAGSTSADKNDDVGHFLKERLKQRAAAAAKSAKKKSANGNGGSSSSSSDPVAPSRKPPPPPKKSNFGDFSGW